jgi:WD40 repeat protein
MKPAGRRPFGKSEWLIVLAPLAVLGAVGIYSFLRPLFPRKIYIGKGAIEYLTFSPDGKQLAVTSFQTFPTKVSNQTWLSLYDVASASRTWQQTVGEWAGYVRYSRDGQVLGQCTATGSKGSTAFRNRQNDRVLYQLPFTWGFLFSRDSQSVLATHAGALCLYDSSGSLRHTFTKTLANPLLAVWDWSRSEKFIAALETDPRDKQRARPRIWDAQGKVLTRLPSGKWMCLRFAGKDQYLILAEENKTVWSDDSLQLWDWRTGKKVRDLAQGADHYFRVTRDGKNLVVIRNFYQWKNGSPIIQGGELRCLSLPEGRVLWSRKKPSATFFYLNDSNERFLLSEERVSTQGDRALLWNAKTGELLQTYDDVSAIAISPDGATVAIGSGEGTVRLYNISRF